MVGAHKLIFYYSFLSIITLDWIIYRSLTEWPAGGELDPGSQGNTAKPMEQSLLW